MMHLERAPWGGPTIASALQESMAAVGYHVDSHAKDTSILGLPRATRLCFILVDGLGVHQLRERSGHAPNLRRIGLDADLGSVIPSTTAAGITALGTGLLPGQTSMAGYALRSPLSGNVFSLISWNEPGLDPGVWQGQPTLFEQLGPRSNRCVLIQPQKFVGSGLTLAALRGARSVTAESLSARVDAAAEQLRAEADVCYLYWGDIDSVGHKFGWNSAQWTAELEEFDAEFGRLLRMLGPDTLVVLTADHGMVDVNTRIDVASLPELTQNVDTVAGESRAVQLYTKDPELVAERWSDFFADQVWLYTKDSLVESGLLGPVNEETYRRIGDVFVFAKDQLVVVDSRVQSDNAINLIGVHGSLTNQEMRVPFVVTVT